MDAGPSASSATLPTRVAGPLPVKRGEIGYDPTSPTENNSPANDDQIIVLPERHPADRDSPHPTSAHSPTRTLSVNQPDIPTTPKGAEAQGFIYGFRTTQVALLSVLLVIIIATVVAWAALGNLLNRNKIPALTGYGSVVVHVIFAVFLITQLIFFERRLYFARAQRFARLHPNALADPTADVCPSTLAPWARPPLPTYAATLAQSGVGTGDVEDHIIAAPPPPAYGNTRGSKLLLSGFLTETMRRERPVSTISTQSRPGDRLNVPQGGERPLSYRSHDEQWEEYCDAQRARILEDTLATLERPASALTRTR